MLFIYTILIALFNSGSSALAFLLTAILACYLITLIFVAAVPKSVFPTNPALQSLAMIHIMRREAGLYAYLLVSAYITAANLLIFTGNIFSFGLIAMAIFFIIM